MPKWQMGEAEVEALVDRRDLELVTGAAADGAPLLAQAQRTAAAAASLVQSDPYSAYVLAYDAARFACNSLLVQQGIRATTQGATMRWNLRSGRNSVKVSGHLQTFGVDGTSLSIPACQQTRPARKRPRRLLRLHKGLSPLLVSY
jgi:hypothetical protein